MSRVSILNSIFQKTINPILTIPSVVQIQQTRNTFVLKRRNKVSHEQLKKKVPRLNQENFIYDLIEYQTYEKARPPIDLILTTFIEGVGDVGDKISIPPYQAYDNYLIPGLAVYATPDNIRKYDKQGQAKVEFSSPYVPKTIKYLQYHLLHVTMSNDNKWTLQNYHIRSALRFDKIYVNDDCIILPERVISGPDLEMENKEFYVTLMINKREKVNVRCRIHLRSKDSRKNLSNPETYTNLSEPLYPEFKEVLDELPIPNSITQKLNSKLKQ